MPFTFLGYVGWRNAFGLPRRTNNGDIYALTARDFFPPTAAEKSSSTKTLRLMPRLLELLLGNFLFRRSLNKKSRAVSA